MPEINLALEQLCDAFNQHDLDKIMSHFADDCVLEMPRGNQPWGSRSEGRESVRKALATRFEGLPDVHYGNPQHFVDAGRLVRGLLGDDTMVNVFLTGVAAQLGLLPMTTAASASTTARSARR